MLCLRALKPQPFPPSLIHTFLTLLDFFFFFIFLYFFFFFIESFIIFSPSLLYVSLKFIYIFPSPSYFIALGVLLFLFTLPCKDMYISILQSIYIDVRIYKLKALFYFILQKFGVNNFYGKASKKIIEKKNGRKK